MNVSVIIPTLNRVRLLRKTLDSIANINSRGNSFELLIVDNGSTDGSFEYVNSLINDNALKNLRCVREPTPGLLSCRHRGYEEAYGDILAYLDDDVILSNGWLVGVIDAFKDNSVHLAGGPSFPYYEKSQPKWLEYFWTRESSFHCCPWLSLIWQGDKILDCDPGLIWGLNFCIRRKTMKEVGGFNPDCIPGHLQHFQGDGESGLARKLKHHGYLSIYHPGIMLHHVITGERMTHEYFKKRFYYEGIVNSYADIRINKGVLSKTQTIHKEKETESFTKKYWQKFRHPRSSIRWFLQQKRYIKNQNLNSTLTEEEQLKSQFHQAYLYGYNYHQEMVNDSPELLRWVLKEDYFDYKLPNLKGYSN